MTGGEPSPGPADPGDHGDRADRRDRADQGERRGSLPGRGIPSGDTPAARSPDVARLFVAAVPPPAVLERLAADLARPALPGLRYTGPAQWHVTLRFLGQAPLARAAAALADVQAPVATVRLGPGTVRLGRRVVCLPASGLDGLAAAVTAATGHLGRPPERRRYSGHLTLARLAGVAGLARGPATVLVGVPFEAAFSVTEIHLMRSRTRPGGAVYDVVASRTVGDGDGPAPG